MQKIISIIGIQYPKKGVHFTMDIRTEICNCHYLLKSCDITIGVQSRITINNYKYYQIESVFNNINLGKWNMTGCDPRRVVSNLYPIIEQTIYIFFSWEANSPRNTFCVSIIFYVFICIVLILSVMYVQLAGYNWRTLSIIVWSSVRQWERVQYLSYKSKL